LHPYGAFEEVIMNIVRKGQENRGELARREWDPLRAMRDLFRWDPFAEMAPYYPSGQAALFSPQFEVKETKNGYLFKADLPGIKDEDLEISLTGNRLTIGGKREEGAREEDDTYYAYERSYGHFTRSFTLPEGADVDHVTAELKNGELTVSIPRKPELQPKRVELTGGDKKKIKA
jgi:HSP20 family protein